MIIFTKKMKRISVKRLKLYIREENCFATNRVLDNSSTVTQLQSSHVFFNSVKMSDYLTWMIKNFEYFLSLDSTESVILVLYNTTGPSGHINLAVNKKTAFPTEP